MADLTGAVTSRQVTAELAVLEVARSPAGDARMPKAIDHE
jgi:hypothetical protein